MKVRRYFGALAVVVAVLVAAPAAGASVTLPPGSIPLPASGSFVYMNSQPGDYIGGGIEQLYTAADTAINGSLPRGGDYFSGSAIQGPYTHWWYFSIAAPPGEPLAEGSYTGAVRAPFRPAGTPGVDFVGDGRGCNTLTGQFDVNELSYTPSGSLLVFDATFEQHCEGGPAALFGRIRIENPPPPPDTTPPSLNLPGDMTVEAPDASGTNVWFSPWASDDRDGYIPVSCTPEPGSFFAVGTATVNCEATDSSGNQATGSFQVHVMAMLELGLTINGIGTASSKTGAATLSGVVRCSRDVSVGVTGNLSQLFARRVSISGYLSIVVDCKAPSTAWSATVTGSNGRFGAGSARLDANAYGCELSCHSVSAGRDVRLTGAK
jgi:HYR domain-containing protein